VPETWARESTHALNEPVSNKSTISVTIGPLQEQDVVHFYACHYNSCISVFTIQYKFAFVTSFMQAEQNTETVHQLSLRKM